MDLGSKNYYELLGVEKTASEDEIRRAYREIARVYHPDSNFYSEIIEVKPDPRVEEHFKLLTAAYSTLIDQEKRAEYDRNIPVGLKSWESESKAYYTEGPITNWDKPAEENTRVNRARKATSAFRRTQFGMVEEETSAFED
ncbi:MAG: J domain-containing protein, partial [Bdellovibrionales bacterium]|nr:J domain-containing protein [Bdellovibrionales bacterium]